MEEIEYAKYHKAGEPERQLQALAGNAMAVL
jgi:hypothetical protein